MENEALSCRTCTPGRIDSLERLALLRQTGLLEETDPDFQRLTDLACNVLDVPIALTSLVDIDRQVFPAQTGLPKALADLKETPLSHSFCQHVVTSGTPLIVENALTDGRVKGNRAIEELGVIAYAGYPIISENQVLGSFCAIHTKPYAWTALELKLVRQFSESISDRITLKLDHTKSQKIQEDLEAANQELRQLSDILAHDLKAPLRGIKGMLGLLQAELSFGDEQAQFFVHALSSAKRMEELLAALNEYSKTFSHPSTKVQINLDDILAEVQQDLKFDIETAHAEVKIEEPLGHVTGHSVLLRQLFQNLMTNGVKFQPAGQSPRILVGRQANGTLFVRDNGIGMTLQDSKEIFKIYKKLHHQSDYPGTGMGLAVCYRVVREHGGRIWVESKEGQGSTFFFYLEPSERGSVERNETIE